MPESTGWLVEEDGSRKSGDFYVVFNHWEVMCHSIHIPYITSLLEEALASCEPRVVIAEVGGVPVKWAHGAWSGTLEVVVVAGTQDWVALGYESGAGPPPSQNNDGSEIQEKLQGVPRLHSLAEFPLASPLLSSPA